MGVCAVHATTPPVATPELVDRRAVAVERFLGFGAEWDPQFWADFNRKLGVTEQDWQTVVRRIEWTHLPVVRMMMQARWCTATGEDRFDWDTPGMRSLYRHPDVCQPQGVTVLLTDWGCATWAKVPGFAGNDDPNYAGAIGIYLDYLLNHRGYTCIKYFILVNEPNFEGDVWDRWKRGVQNVARAIADRKLQLTVVGTDESNDDWTFCIANRGAAERSWKLKVPAGGRHQFKRYVYNQAAAPADRQGFPAPIGEQPADLNAGIVVASPGNAVVILTMFVRQSSAGAVARGVTFGSPPTAPGARAGHSGG